MQDDELGEVYRISFSVGHKLSSDPISWSASTLWKTKCVLHECGLYTVPTIGVIDTDANPSWVTYPIPANDDSQRSISLIAGVLSRAAEEGQRMRKDAALRGVATYSKKVAKRYLEDVATIASMDVQETDRSKDKDE